MEVVSSLREYFEEQYLAGGLFSHEDYEFIEDEWVWRHKPLDIKVWADALDLSSETEPHVYFHYTSHLGFRNITDPSKATAEVFASMVTPEPGNEDKKGLNAYWGQGVYATRRPPDKWKDEDGRPCLHKLLDNNYGSTYKRDHYKRFRADYCIPILASAESAYDVSQRQTPEMEKGGKPPGVNLAGRDLLHREVIVIRMLGKGGGVSSAKASLLEVLSKRTCEMAHRLTDTPNLELREELCKAKCRLAQVHVQRGQLKEAEDLFSEVESTAACLAKERQAGSRWAKFATDPSSRIFKNRAPDTFDAVAAWQGLAETYKLTGRLADAEELNRKVLALRAWNRGETHRQTLVSKLSLTQVLMSRGQFRKAERLARSTVTDLETEMGPRHPDTLEASLTLANILKESGCLDEAEELQEQGWTTCKELLGPQHPRTVASLRDWASVLLEQEDFKRAEEKFREAEEEFEKSLGAMHPQTLDCKVSRAVALSSQRSRKGSLQMAEQLFVEALQELEQLLGASHPDTTWCCFGLAMCLRALQRPLEAEQRLRDTLARLRGSQGQDHWKAQLCQDMIRQVASFSGCWPLFWKSSPLLVVLLTIVWRAFAMNLAGVLELHLALAAGQLFLMILVLGVGLFFLQRSRVIPPAGPKEKWGIRFRDQHHVAKAFAQGVHSLAAYFLFSLIFSIFWFILDAISRQEEYEDSAIVAWGHPTAVCGWAALEVIWLMSDVADLLDRRSGFQNCWVLLASLLPIRVLRPASLHMHLHATRQIRSWDEIAWPCSWLLFFLCGFLLRNLGYHLQALVRSRSERLWPMDGRRLHKARRAGIVVRQCIETVWCLLFVAFVAIGEDCHGQYVVSGAVASGRFCNGDYHFAGRYEERPFYTKSVGVGFIYFWGSSGQWRLSDRHLNETQTDTANYVPLGTATPPTEGDWVLSELWGGPCLCEDEPPNISVCHEQTCEGDLIVSEVGLLESQGNGQYAYTEDHNAKPFYRQIGGDSVIYFDVSWRINTQSNSTDRQTFIAPTSPLPPVGQWVTEDVHRPEADPPPFVSECAGCDGDYIVSGAGGEGSWCNGEYSYARRNDGKPLFQQIGGECIIYHMNQWKITYENQTGNAYMGSWYYIAPGFPEPPLGKWENIPCKFCGRDPARVTPCHSASCDYVVSGADGTFAEYNGQYRQTGIRVNGKPVYQLQQSPLDRYIFHFWSWKIGFYWDLAIAGAVYDSPAQSLPPTGTWGRESWYEGQTSDSDILQVSPCRGRPSLVVLPVVIVASLATCCLAVRKVRPGCRSSPVHPADPLDE
ncbi:nphp3 [Symbiodinium sp. CCMP2592]|nr:nphp3 [Symbiodinium sp. CCMP2592]